MKTQYVVLLLLSILFTACGCDDDNNNDDNQNVLTDENFMKESDTYIIHLEKRMADILVELDFIYNDPNNVNHQTLLLAAKNDSTYIQGETDFIRGIVAEVDIEEIEIPMPPCPGIIVADCVPRSLAFFIVNTPVTLTSLQFIEEQQQENVGTVGTAFPLTNFESYYNAVPVDLNGFTGPITISINRLDRFSNPVSYEYNGTVGN